MDKAKFGLEHNGDIVSLWKIIDCESGAFTRSASFKLEQAAEIMHGIRRVLGGEQRACFGMHGISRRTDGLEVYDGSLMGLVLTATEAEILADKWDAMVQAMPTARRIRILHVCRDCQSEENHAAGA